MPDAQPAPDPSQRTDSHHCSRRPRRFLRDSRQTRMDKHTGRRLERFKPLERFMPWTVVLCIIILTASGIVMMFGRCLVLPLFSAGLVVLLLTFIRDDIPSKRDFGWLAPDGGIFGGREGLSPRFDAGEKFSSGWAGCFSARWRSAPALSWGQMRAKRRFHPRRRQVAETVHVSATVVLVAMFFAYIYLGAIDVGGSLGGVRTRYVDDRLVKQHRALWLDRSNAGKVPAQRTGCQRQVGSQCGCLATVPERGQNGGVLLRSNQGARQTHPAPSCRASLCEC